ncbi:MAG TPA: tetratricopeptide repeat protein, partial [Candidatus Nanopelagicales bacterium]|nr:tetratricopeptide repeat protein [Candidatus Nanopelagicales bacterium]
MRIIRRWWKSREYRRLHDAAADALAAGRDAEAEDVLTRALTLAEELFGPEDLENVPLLYALASARLAQGHLEQAEASSRRAITIAESAPGAEPPLPRLLEQRAAILERRGDVDDMEALLRRMLAGYDRMRAPDPAQQSAALTRLGLLLGRRGQRQEAAPLLARARAAGAGVRRRAPARGGGPVQRRDPPRGERARGRGRGHAPPRPAHRR